MVALFHYTSLIPLQVSPPLSLSTRAPIEYPSLSHALTNLDARRPRFRVFIKRAMFRCPSPRFCKQPPVFSSARAPKKSPRIMYTLTPHVILPTIHNHVCLSSPSKKSEYFLFVTRIPIHVSCPLEL